ncbi:MAG: glycosyltransferase family 39 protein [Desulfobacterales bacterium]|nr:glycosyltransferase family 39 protein [Desulfobacterales bacterium]
MIFSESDINEKKFLLAIFLIALGIRLFLMCYFESYDMGKDWKYSYETGNTAKAVAKGQGLSSPYRLPTGPTAILPPLYPCFLAFIFKIFGIFSLKSAIAALTVNCIASALTCIPLYYITKKLFGHDVGYITASVFAIHPSPVWYAINTVWDTSVFTFFCMVLVCRMMLLPDRLNNRNIALFGIFAGITILVKTLIIIFYPVMLLWLFLQSPLTPGKRISYIAGICLVTFITLSPWIIRNYIFFDRIMLRSNLGLELLIENNMKIWNTFEMTGEDSKALWREHPYVSHREFLVYKRLGEVNYMDMCLDKAKAFIRQHPGKFFKLTVRRVIVFWFGDIGEKNEWKGNLKISFSMSGIKKLVLILPLPFMLIGIFSAIRRKIDIMLPAAYLILLPAVYYITHVFPRFRSPVEPVILMFAVYGIYVLVLRASKVARFCKSCR